MLSCPTCHSKTVKENGFALQKQNYLCLACRSQFVEVQADKRISEETQLSIEKILFESLPIEGICQVFEVSMPWLLKFLNSLMDKVPENQITLVTRSKDLEVALLEIDEHWSYVGSQRKPRWLWLALDTSSRQVLAIHIGLRTKSNAEALLSKLPDDISENPSFAQISFQCTSKYFLGKDIAPKSGEEVTQITWRDFISPSGKVAGDLSETPKPPPKIPLV